MLAHLAIRDFAILDRLELDSEAGLTVLTGETGAGKSIVIDALALALGERRRGGRRPSRRHARRGHGAALRSSPHRRRRAG